MKIQYMSDLHLEFAPMPVPPVLGDVLVLAGDIHLGVNAIPWIEQCAQKFEHVIYILGNHEYYGQMMWKLPDKIRRSLAGYSMDDPAFPAAVTPLKLNKLFDPITNVYFLDNESVTLDGVHFHGSTMWMKGHPSLKYRMNDFKKITCKYIYNQYGKFSVDKAAELHLKAKDFLHSAIVPGETNVVITHHAPSQEMVNLIRYRDDEMNSGYFAEVIHEFSPDDVKLWISGHTHAASDKVLSGIHSVSNCRGYVHSQGDLAESYHLDNKQRMNTYRNGPISHDIFVKLKYHYSD